MTDIFLFHIAYVYEKLKHVMAFLKTCILWRKGLNFKFKPSAPTWFKYAMTRTVMALGHDCLQCKSRLIRWWMALVFHIHRGKKWKQLILNSLSCRLKNLVSWCNWSPHAYLLKEKNGIQSNPSTTASLGEKKVTVVERWSLVEVRL